MLLLLENAADIVDRQVLLTEIDDGLPNGITLRAGFGAGLALDEEGAQFACSEVAYGDIEAARGVPEFFGGLSDFELVDEYSAERLIEALLRSTWFGEEPGFMTFLPLLHISYLIHLLRL